MIRQGMHDHIDKFDNYRHELASLMPWLGMHIIKHSDYGSALQVLKCTMLIKTIEGGDYLRTMMEDRMKPHTSGVTT